jgi:hypothetical protein
MDDDHILSDEDIPELGIDLQKPVGDLTIKEIRRLMAVGSLGSAGSTAFIPKVIKDGKDWFDKGATKDLKDAKDIIDVIKRYVETRTADIGQQQSPGAGDSNLGEAIAALTGLKKELQTINKRLDKLEKK